MKRKRDTCSTTPTYHYREFLLFFLFSSDSSSSRHNKSFALSTPLAMSKRPVSPPGGGALIKRAKSSADGSGASTTREIAISSNNDPRNKSLIRSVQRTSGLDAPIVSLAGAHSVSSISISPYPFECTDRLCRRVKSFLVASLHQVYTSQPAPQTAPYLFGTLTHQTPTLA